MNSVFNSFNNSYSFVTTLEEHVPAELIRYVDTSYFIFLEIFCDISGILESSLKNMQEEKQ